jgi:hypothetical protein
MLKRNGDYTHKESAARADELAAEGDDDGAAIWRVITHAAEQLTRCISRKRGVGTRYLVGLMLSERDEPLKRGSLSRRLV